MSEKLSKRLADIQTNLKVPKSLYNKFGKYNYRSCEAILESVKPLLGNLNLRLEDEVVNIGERYYVKSTAILSDGQSNIQSIAYAREAESKKGMDESQITGAASSYARKYALNGLLAIDDTKDADHSNQQVSPNRFESEEEYNMAAKGKENRDNIIAKIENNPYEIFNDTMPEQAIPANEKRMRIVRVLVKMNNEDDEKAKEDLKSIFKVDSTKKLTGETLRHAYKKILEFAADGLNYEKEKGEMEAENG